MGIIAIGTYLPPWDGGGGQRKAGRDEDALTIGVVAGRAALEAAGAVDVQRVVFVSRQLPLLEGDNSAALLAGVGLGHGVDVVEQLGGAPAALDAVASAPPGTLVIAADSENGAGGGAAYVGIGEAGAATSAARVHRSLPITLRTQAGDRYVDDDPRLVRERGVRASIDAAGLPGKPLVLAGMKRKDAAPFCVGDTPDLPTTGASAGLFALAAIADRKLEGLVGAVEQATLAVVQVAAAAIAVKRVEPAAQPIAKQRVGADADIKFTLSAYERAFEAKLRWEAGCCDTCGTLALPARYRCLNCGAENASHLVPLPRTATVYTTTTIHTSVPGLASPYTLAVVQCGGTDVRALVTVTDVPPGSVDIDDRGTMVLRRIAERNGVPDYGYAFSPEGKN
ncbi:MAG: OB-fold domain-containing protein [Acidimicrobiia bacterium]